MSKSIILKSIFALNSKFYFKQVCDSLKVSIVYEGSRSICKSSVVYGKRNFRKFLYHRRGTPCDHKWFKKHPEEIDLRGMRRTAFMVDGKLQEIPEMVPELIVPDLKNFELKPYVSYRAADVVQEEFTPEHLFYAIYAKKLKEDFESGKLDEEGNSLEPSEEEKLSAEEAWRKARSTGSDYFG